MTLPKIEFKIMTLKDNIDLIKWAYFVKDETLSLHDCVINYFKENNKNTKAGFIHVPYIKEQVENKENMPYMELNDIVKGLSICIKESVGD